MSRSASWAAEPAPRPKWLAKGARTIAAIIAAIVASQYLAGYFFLWSIHGSPLQATPLTIATYAYYFADLPGITQRIWVCLAFGVGLVTMCAFAALLPAPRPLHGQARFARRHEVARAGLLGHVGIVLGELGSRYLMLPGQQGVILAAPPRAGKGAGIVIPNALNWPDSLVCTDIKHENWKISAGYRSRCGQECHLFDPLSEEGRTSRWNPLTYVSSHPERRINDLQRIADMLYPETPGTDPFWIASARSLFVGIALYLFETPSLPRTIGEILRQGMASGEEGFGAHWKRLVEGRANGKNPLSSTCVRALYDVIDLAPVTASSIRKTFTSRLDLWLNPILDAATSGDDFDLRELRKRPLSIYVGVNPDDLHRLRPVLSLFFQQTIGLQTRELPEHNPELKRQVLLLLDEFAALGRIPIIAEAVSYLPGYNVRTVLVIQSPSQLREVYGQNAAETITKSLAARIVFQPRDMVDAKEISEELGFTTVKGRSRSRPRRFGFSSGHSSSHGSVTESDQRRALMLPQEVQSLGTDHAIIFYESTRPIRCRKIRYFRDRHFQARLYPPPARPLQHATTPAPQVQALAPAQTAKMGSRDVVTAQEGESMNHLTAHVETRPSGREATLEDIQQWDKLKLEDFAGDFSRVELPVDRPATGGEMSLAVDQFLEGLTH